MKNLLHRKRINIRFLHSRPKNQSMLSGFGVGLAVLLSACMSVKPASEEAASSIDAYVSPEESGLIAKHQYPNTDSVCVSLHSNALTKPFEIETHFLIACPVHETGAIEDRESNEKAQIVGNIDKWLVMRIELIPST